MIVTVGLALGIVEMDQHDLPARPAGERSRLLIDRIAKGLDRSPHALPRFRANIRAVVEDSRDRNASNASGLGDIVNGCVALHARRLAIHSSVRNG